MGGNRARAFLFNASVWITFQRLYTVQIYFEFSDILPDVFRHIHLCTSFVLMGIHENLDLLMANTENLTLLE